MSHDPFFPSEADELTALGEAGAWAGAVNSLEEISDSLRKVLSEAEDDFANGRVTVTSITELRREVEDLEQEAA